MRVDCISEAIGSMWLRGRVRLLECGIEYGQWQHFIKVGLYHTQDRQLVFSVIKRDGDKV